MNKYLEDQTSQTGLVVGVGEEVLPHHKCTWLLNPGQRAAPTPGLPQKFLLWCLGLPTLVPSPPPSPRLPCLAPTGLSTLPGRQEVHSQESYQVLQWAQESLCHWELLHSFLAQTTDPPLSLLLAGWAVNSQSRGLWPEPMVTAQLSLSLIGILGIFPGKA